LKASSTALGKEGIDGIERVSSAGAEARGGSLSSLSLDELGVGSSSGTGTTAGPRYRLRAWFIASVRRRRTLSLVRYIVILMMQIVRKRHGQGN
jgi:hypothetical protein